jgi:hypothetical protein
LAKRLKKKKRHKKRRWRLNAKLKVQNAKLILNS